MMKFPTDLRLLLCLLLAGLLLAGCAPQVTPAPGSIQVSPGEGNTFFLSWEPAADATGYRVYRRVSGSPDFKFVSDTRQTHFTDSPPEAGVAYDYQVTALGAGGESAGAIFIGAALEKEPVPLSEPRITSVTRLDPETVVVFFSDENLSCTHRIQRSRDGGQWESLGTTADPLYYDKNAREGHSYRYRVLAESPEGQQALSEPAAEGTAPKTVFGVPVLMYHEFVTQEDLDRGVVFDEYAIYAQEFAHDLQWLQDNGFTTVTVLELAQYLEGQGTMPEKPVILTIDDGKLGVYKNAFPLLVQYDMKAVLAVIGAEIHEATLAPEQRATDPAPYCTWPELAEMSASGHMEIASHSYGLHVYRHGDRVGADCGREDNLSDFSLDAHKDFRQLQDCLKNSGIPETVTFAYPYSIRSGAADRVWLRCGYQMLLGGNMDSVRATRTNYFIQEAGLNSHCALLRRVARMHGTPIEDYIG